MSWPLYVLKNGLGDPCWVYIDLNSAGNSPVTPMEPPVIRLVTMGANSGAKVLDHGRLVLLGYHYDYVAGAASVGFDLFWADYRTGARILRKIFGVRSQAAARVEGGCPSTFVVGPPGAFVSPGPPGLVRQAANLFCMPTSTLPTFGSLLLWGYLSDSDNNLAQLQTGSPTIFPG